MADQQKKSVVGKVIEGLVESTKLQYEITKERHNLLTKSPTQAKEEFLERHEHANKSPIERQKIELEELKKQNNAD